MGTENGLLRQILRFGPIADEAEDIAVDARVVLTELDPRLRPCGWKGLCHRDAIIAPGERRPSVSFPRPWPGLSAALEAGPRQRGHRAVLGAQSAQTWSPSTNLLRPLMVSTMAINSTTAS